MKIASSGNKKGLDELLAEISSSIPDKESLQSDVERYVNMDLTAIPDFNEDGSVAFYECGGILLGRNALIRFIERCR